MPSRPPPALSRSTGALTSVICGPYGLQVHKAAQAELEGVVDPATSGGLIRYRVWPARRQPLRLMAVVLACLGLTSGAALTAGTFWAVFVLIGLILSAGVLLFPTEVALDSYTLHVRALGTPRTWDLRHFRRFEVSAQPWPRVELTKRTGFELLDNVSIPLPQAHEAVLAHLRSWVGRQPTGTFELDDDLVPEDNV